VLRVGLFSRSSSDATVSAGAGEFPGVVSENRSPQSEGVDDIPPAELTQVDIAFASVLMSADGMAVSGTPFPGESPVVELASWFASVKAEVSAEVSEEEEPIAVMELMKGARALTAATVVTSLTEMNVEGVSDEQGPRAVISARLGFEELIPGLPPTAVRYTNVALSQE
jgi:hypothetical protein